jgi:hypothetical protein
VSDDVIDVVPRAPLPLSLKRLDQPGSSNTSDAAHRPIDRGEGRSAVASGSTSVPELTIPSVARSVSRAGEAAPVAPADGRPLTSQRPADVDLTLARLEPPRTSGPSAPRLARSAAGPESVPGIPLAPLARTWAREGGGSGSSDRGPIGVAGVPGTGSRMLVTRAIGRPAAFARGREPAGHADLPGTLPASLPLYRSSIVSDTVEPARDSMESTAERSTPLVVVARSNDPSPEGSGGALSFRRAESASGAQRDTFDSRVMLLALRSAALPSGARYSPTVQSTELRSTAMAPPELMRAPWSRASERPHDGGPGTAASSELVLVARTADGNGHVMAIQRIGEGVVPSTPPTPAAAGGRARAVGVEAVPATPAPAAGAKPQIDLDELVEKAWQKLMRKVAIEQERRGYTRWPWQS